MVKRQIVYDKESKKLCANCTKCGRIICIPCTVGQLKRFRNGELIQSVFPKVSADDREVFLSGICGKCFDDMFAYLDEL